MGLRELWLGLYVHSSSLSWHCVLSKSRRRCTDALSQIPGSMLSVKYGAKYTWWVFLMGAGFFNFCVPIAGSLAPMFGFEPLYGVMLCRFMFGSFQGSLFPIQTSILAGWLHVKERSTITAAVGCCWSFFQARPLSKKACKKPRC